MKRLLFNGKNYAALMSINVAGCNGFFKQGRNGDVTLYKLDGKLEALVLNNARQDRFVVSASTNGDGQPFYMHSTSSLTEKWLGIDGMKHSVLPELIGEMQLSESLDVAKSFVPTNDEVLSDSVIPADMQVYSFRAECETDVNAIST